MITTVVFDADETLIDIRPAVRSALGVVLAEMRRLAPAAGAVTMADLEADWRVASDALATEPIEIIRRYALARSLARVGLESELDRITKLFFTHRFAMTRVYADVPAVLAALGSSYRIGYATNGNTPAHRVGLAGKFLFEVYAGLDGVPKKPAAGFYAAVVTAARCDPGSIVHVGDNWEHDIAGAAAAGLRTIWLNRSGLPRPVDLPAVPDAEIRTLAQLPAALTRC